MKAQAENPEWKSGAKSSMPVVRAVFSGLGASRLFLVTNVCKRLHYKGLLFCDWYIDGWATKKRIYPRDVSVVRVLEMNVWCVLLGPGVFCGPIWCCLVEGFRGTGRYGVNEGSTRDMRGCRWIAWSGAFPKWPCGDWCPRDHPFRGEWVLEGYRIVWCSRDLSFWSDRVVLRSRGYRVIVLN